MSDAYRILDANFNRAREALRVAEDYARFVLNDAALSATAKSLRDQLRSVYETLGADHLLAWRDTSGDVGTEIESPGEHRRSSTAAVATAACKRLTEALRVIEEYAKIESPGAASAAEQVRYRAYTFEQRLIARVDVAARFAQSRLYVLLTTSLCKGDPVLTAHAAAAGGADCIQLREKDLSDRQLLELARRVRAATLETRTLLVINDRPDIAALVAADGVHVGQDDMPVAAARQIVGGDRLVGLSTHSLEQARAAAETDCDYIGVGPMFVSPTKAAARIPGPRLLTRVAAEIDAPHVAIGGITADNVERLAAAGAQRVAVCQAVVAAADPKAAARVIKERFCAAASEEAWK